MDCVREVRDGAPLRVIAVRSDDFATEVDAAASLIESAVVAERCVRRSVAAPAGT